MAASNQGRWKDGNRKRRYDELRQIIETVGCPLKRELVAKGFRDEEIRAGITFSVKLTPEGETLDIQPTASQLDYDPGDPSRWAAEFAAAKRGGCDRNGIWHPVFTLCGRVHGYFEENESREVERLWSRKAGHWPGPTAVLLERVTVSLMAAPSDHRFQGTRTAPDAASAALPAPTFSASFLDFAEGTAAPIRFERGAPPPEGKRSRAVDRETGEYLESYRLHWQHPTIDYLLHSADGTTTGTATVQQEAVDLSGDGKVGLYKVRILDIRQASADGSWTEISDPASSSAGRFPPFIAAFLVDQHPARHSVEITFDLGGKVS
jgi:hypothetical protein